MQIRLNEGSRDNALAMFLPLFQKRGIEMNVSRLKQALLTKFVSEAGMHALSQGSNFYLLGVARYYFNGDLTTNTRLNLLYPQYKDTFKTDVCTRLDALVNILRNAYIDTVGKQFEQPEDFGNMTIEALLKKYNRKINETLGIETPSKKKKKEEPEKKEVSTDYSCGKNYTYEILYSYEDAQKYKQYTEPGAWCITYGKGHYDGYIKRLGIHYVIFRMNGFENVPRRKGPNWTARKPQDEYGNSLIAVLQSNRTGEPVYITSRWNHGSDVDHSRCEADHAYTKEEFLKVIGDNGEVLSRCFEQWKANAEIEKKQRGGADRKAANAEKLGALRAFKYAQMMINGGAPMYQCVNNGIVLDGRDPSASKYKGMYLVNIEVGDDKWATLMDRKQLFFDNYLVKMNYSLGRLVSRNSRTFIVLSNAEETFYMIYDKVHHRFLEIDGVSKFKHLDSDLTWQSRDDYEYNYFIVGVSGNQVALINTNSMKPVRARNGSGWFEFIGLLKSNETSNTDYSRHIRLHTIRNGELVRMIYDSASGEEYVFNTADNSFVQTRNGEDGFRISKWQKYNPNGYILYFKGDESNILNTNLTYRLQNASTGEWLRLNGHDTFTELRMEKNVFAYKAVGGDVAHYVDMEKGWNPLILNGQEVTTNTIQMIENAGYVAISMSPGYFWKKVLLYNPISHTFYHDDISGWYFNVYCGIKVYNPKEDDRYTYNILTPEHAAEKMQQDKENVTSQFNDMTQRINNL